MRVTIRPFVMALSMSLTAPLNFAALSQNVLAQEAASPDEVKQIALTDTQIDAFLAAQEDVEAIIAKVPEGDQSDPKMMEQLDAAAKKYKFANYAEYDDVAGNISLVMSGINPDTKKYVGDRSRYQKGDRLGRERQDDGAERQKGTARRIAGGTEITPRAGENPRQYRARDEKLRQARRLVAKRIAGYGRWRCLPPPDDQQAG
jgi:hypothetical protein